jgi:hypothetical protein
MKADDQPDTSEVDFKWKFGNVPKSMEHLLPSSRMGVARDVEERRSRTIFCSLPEDRDKCDIGGITEVVYPAWSGKERDPFKAVVIDLLAREEMTLEDLERGLSQKRWSLLEAAHIICNKRLMEDKQKQRTIPKDIFIICLKILQAVEDESLPQKAIMEKISYKPLTKGPIAQAHELEYRKGERNVRGIDEEGRIANLGDFESDKLYWSILPEVFVEWALDNCLILSVPLMEILRLIPPVDSSPVKKMVLTEAESNCLSFIHEKGFDGFKKLHKLNTLSKSEKGHMRLQVAAQILWHYNPEFTYENLLEHSHFKKIAGEEELKTYEKGDLGDRPTKPMRLILKSIDPRPKRKREKRIYPWAPKAIPEIIFIAINGSQIIHFQKLRFIAKEFGLQMRQLYPKRKDTTLLNHLIMKPYLSHLHLFVLRMARHWLLPEVMRNPYVSVSFNGENRSLCKTKEKVCKILQRARISATTSRAEGKQEKAQPKYFCKGKKS